VREFCGEEREDEEDEVEEETGEAGALTPDPSPGGRGEKEE